MYPQKSQCRSDYPDHLVGYLAGANLTYDSHKCDNLFNRHTTVTYCGCLALPVLEGDVLFDWSQQKICEFDPEGATCLQGLLDVSSNNDISGNAGCRLECDLTNYKVSTRTSSKWEHWDHTLVRI